MNTQKRLERLSERFLRVADKGMLKAAKVEGGLIFREIAINNEIVAGSDKLAAFLREYFDCETNPMDFEFSEFVLESAFNICAMIANDDPNALGLKFIKHQTGVSVGISGNQSLKAEAERLAAFCDRLSRELTNVAEQVVTPEIESDQQVYDRVSAMFRGLVDTRKSSPKSMSHSELGELIANQVTSSDWRKYHKVASRSAQVIDDPSKHFESKSKRAARK